MPSLLEQAIIDANELREAALKNAESSILEKYSTEVKGAVSALLEQEMPMPEDEEEMMGMPPGMPPGMQDAMMGGPMPPPAAPEGPLGAVPPGAGAGMDLCPCPDDPEEVTMEFNIDDLMATAGLMEPGQPAPHEELMGMGMPMGPGQGGMHMPPGGAPPMPQMMAESMSRLADEISFAPLHEEVEIDEDLLFEYEDEENLDEEIDLTGLTAEGIKDLVGEMLTVDTGKQPAGWYGTPTEVMQFEEDLEEAGAQSTEEENADAKTFRTQLDESIQTLGKKDKLIGRMKAEKKSLLESNRELKDTFMLMKEQFDQTNLSNAKLLYTNRTLMSTSLNERQKNRIVESIQNADTIEEAKVIYETLQSAVGGSVKDTPKSLNEAITRPSNHVPRRRNARSKHEGALKDRFKALAGIK